MNKMWGLSFSSSSWKGKQVKMPEIKLVLFVGKMLLVSQSVENKIQWSQADKITGPKVKKPC